MANLWKKIKIRFNKYKTRMLTAVFAVVPSFFSELPHRELPEFKLAKEINLDLSADTMEEAFKKGKCADLMSFVEKSPHINDTVVLNCKNVNMRLCAGVYQQKDDKVRLKYFVPDISGADSATARKIIRYTKAWNDEFYRMSNKAHEYKHRHTHKSGTFKTGVCMEDNARLSQHNEIASYITNLLYEREVYLAMSRSGIYAREYLDDIISSRFQGYKDAVKQGIVKPGSTNPRMQEMENFLIAKTVSEWWIKKEQNVNVGVTLKRLNWFVKAYPWLVQKKRDAGTLRAYVRALDKCYTFIKDGRLVNLNYFQRGPFDYNPPEQPEAWKNWSGAELFGPHKLKDVELKDTVKMRIAELRGEAPFKFQMLKDTMQSR